MNITLDQINTLRAALNLAPLKELPAINYPDSSVFDVYAFPEMDNDEIELFNMIANKDYEYIAFYSNYIRFIAAI